MDKIEVNSIKVEGNLKSQKIKVESFSSSQLGPIWLPNFFNDDDDDYYYDYD